MNATCLLENTSSDFVNVSLYPGQAGNRSNCLEFKLTSDDEVSRHTTQIMSGGIGITVLNQQPSMPGTVALWFELSAFIAIDILGLVGNLLVFSIIASKARIRTSANLFIFSLSVADLLVCVLVLPMVIVCRHRRQWPLGHVMCQLQAFINLTTVFASVFNLAAIAVNRAVATTAYQRYKIVFSKSWSILYIAITWFCSLLYALFPVIGWSFYAFDQKALACVYSDTVPSYPIFFSLFGFVIPLTVSAVSYAIVLATFFKSRRTLRRFGIQAISNQPRSEIKLTKNVFIVWLAFFICWIPTNLYILIDPKDSSDGLRAFMIWMMMCNSCINPIIYGTQRRFRNECLLMLRKLRCPKRHPSIHPSNR